MSSGVSTKNHTDRLTSCVEEFGARCLRLSSAGLVMALFVPLIALAEIPAEQFDLRFWKLTLPLDDNNDGKVD